MVFGGQGETGVLDSIEMIKLKPSESNFKEVKLKNQKLLK